MPDHSTRRRSLLKVAAGGAAAVGGIAVASRTGLIPGTEQGAESEGLPRLLLSADDGSGVAALEAALGDDLLPRVGPRRWRSAQLPTTTHSMVAFVWPRDEPAPRLRISSRHDGRWTGWRTIPVLSDLPDERDPEQTERAGTQLVWIGSSDGIRIQAEGHRAEGLTLVLLHPRRRDSDSRQADAPRARTQANDAGSPVARPAMLGRKAWGADESWRNGAPRYNSTIEQVHVHHTVNSNDYAPDDVPGLLRGIYRYHTHSLGWSDIAYNFLVDRFGRTWVGRAGGAAKPVRGAHTLGFNGSSTGVAVIGNYEGIDPGRETLSAIVHVAAWKLAMHGRDPAGTVAVISEGSDKFGAAEVALLPVIDGHRDTNDTACPGQRLYDRLPDVRTRAKRRVEEAASPAVTVSTPFGLTGDTVVGASLTVTAGVFSPADATVTYTWLRNGVPTGDDPALASRPLVPEDVGQQVAVLIDIQKPGYTGASQTLTATAPVDARAVVHLRLRRRRGNITAKVRVSAPGLPTPPAGEIRIRADRRKPRTVPLVDGRAVVRFVDFGPGLHTVRAVYPGADLTRPARARDDVRVVN